MGVDGDGPGGRHGPAADATGIAGPATPAVVIFDLDGTLLSTETLVLRVARRVLGARGVELTAAAAAAGLGLRPLEAWRAVVKALGLDDRLAEDLLAESEAELAGQWAACQALPGATRVVAHLARHGVRLALATSTPRATYAAKTSGAGGAPFGREAFGAAVICGDDVEHGKPHPEIFLAAAAAAGVPPSSCLVVEDAASGAEAALAAGMACVVVPSARDATLPRGVAAVLPSLLDFRPEAHGLPPFDDYVCGTVPLLPGPFRLAGVVVRGFGRGSAQLGIPTANLAPECVAAELAEAVTGIYAAFASLGPDTAVHPAVM